MGLESVSCVSSSYIPLSRSEEGSPGRSELLQVREVYRSVAKTLDGRRSEGYMKVRVQQTKLRKANPVVIRSGSPSSNI